MDTLTPEPTIVAQSFAGYQHFQDITLQPFNTLTYPSKNCTVPKFDKVVPDKGKLLNGQAYTQDTPIIGNKEKFTTMGGISTEVRVFNSEKYLEFNTLVGTFDIGETITGGTSTRTAIIISKDTNKILLKTVSGPFQVGETITGGTSAATATVTVEHTTYGDTIEVLYTDTNINGSYYNTPHYYQITENVNPLPIGLHRYSFDQWFDTNLTPSLSLNLPRLVWVNGLSKVFTWTGGIAPIVSMVANTSISTTTGITWASLGFVSTALGGSGNIIINGKAYAITGGWDTSTLTLTDTTGISVYDIAFSQIQYDDVTTPYDYCKQSKGHMFYGTWNSRKEPMSNAFNRPATNASDAITNSQAIQNDMVVSNNPYTGTSQEVYRISIDSVNPNIDIQTYTSNSGLYDGSFNTSSYSGAAGIKNIYKVVVVATYTLAGVVGPGTFKLGEYIKGSTSSAIGVLVTKKIIGVNIELGIVPTYGIFDSLSFETVIGMSSGASLTLSDGIFQNWIQGYKNETLLTITSGPFTSTIVPILAGGSISLTDGISITFGNYFGHILGDYWELTINKGGADTFKWQLNNGSYSSPISIVANTNIAIGSNGVQVKFMEQTGHTIGDFWEITENPKIDKAWLNMYYTQPSRRPGEGFIFNLPSNFWTMDTQEDKLYVNTQYGEWSVITAELSSDLLSEKVSLTPLKQSGALKCIDPWMTGHLEDQLIFVTDDKSLMSIGRKEFLQEPQDGYLSDAVKLDFEPCSFINGGIKYIGKRLYITSPEQSIMHCYDVSRKYWQAPKTFPEMGIPTVIGNKLHVHSNIRNQTFEMFSNTSDNGQAYEVEMRTPYTAFIKMVNKKRLPARWASKFSGASFIEGYITGAPELVHTAYSGVGGCGGVDSHTISPVVCLAKDSASFGQGSFGSHPLGSDIGIQGDYFNEIYSGYSPLLSYYFIALGIKCTAKNHSYAILSMGMNMTFAPTGNDSLWNTKSEIL